MSEATVKRWADAGVIRCFRTPGGHRKFRMSDVAAFLRTHNYDPLGALVATEALAPAPPSDAPAAQTAPLVRGERIDAVARFRDSALAGDTDGLVSLIAQLRLGGRSLVEIFDHVAGPALHDIGERWARGVLTVSQEHIASQAVIEALARIRPLLERAPHDRGKAVLACPADELHDVAIRMASLLLHTAGYRTILVGPRAPVLDLCLLITQERPRLVCLSASPSSDPGALADALARVAESGRNVAARVLVGGGGVATLPSLPDGVRAVGSLRELLDAGV